MGKCLQNTPRAGAWAFWASGLNRFYHYLTPLRGLSQNIWCTSVFKAIEPIDLHRTTGGGNFEAKGTLTPTLLSLFLFLKKILGMNVYYYLPLCAHVAANHSRSGGHTLDKNKLPNKGVLEKTRTGATIVSH